MRRRRWRTAVLWVGCTLCALMAVLFVVSVWWYPWAASSDHFIAVYSGAFEYYYERPHTGLAGLRRHGTGLRLRLALVAKMWPAGDGFTLPLIYPFAAVAIPTLAVWWFGRRRRIPRGHCQRCGYNLTGLTEARCPECGTQF